MPDYTPEQHLYLRHSFSTLLVASGKVYDTHPEYIKTGGQSAQAWFVHDLLQVDPEVFSWRPHAPGPSQRAPVSGRKPPKRARTEVLQSLLGSRPNAEDLVAALEVLPEAKAEPGMEGGGTSARMSARSSGEGRALVTHGARLVGNDAAASSPLPGQVGQLLETGPSSSSTGLEGAPSSSPSGCVAGLSARLTAVLSDRRGPLPEVRAIELKEAVAKGATELSSMATLPDKRDVQRHLHGARLESVQKVRVLSMADRGDKIEAAVQGSADDVYSVVASKARPLGASCSCPDYSRRGQLCKHGGAALGLLVGSAPAASRAELTTPGAVGKWGGDWVQCCHCRRWWRCTSEERLKFQPTQVRFRCVDAGGCCVYKGR